MKPDDELFDSERFRQSLINENSGLSAFKQALEHGYLVMEQRFAEGIPVTQLVRQRAWLIDQVLLCAWREHQLDNDEFCLAAVGGYGRGELHPGSDIDLFIISNTEAAEDDASKLSSFITFLWDIGLEVGQNVCTIEQCREEGIKDITVATNLMEARFIAGNSVIFVSMCKKTGPDQIWPTHDFFKAKHEEQILRHKKFGDTAHNLEPNIKEGAGGLRDIQMIGWVAKRYFGASSLRELVSHAFLTKEEFETLDEGQNFLWRVRYLLHRRAKRREDRLLFEYQRHIAAEFGFVDDEQQLAVEGFMKLFYRTTTELSRLNEMLLGFFDEALLENPRNFTLKPINKRFQIKNNSIMITFPRVFERSPYALLELFLMIQQHPEIKGVRAKTIRAIRDHLHLINEDFHNDLINRSLFMEIIRQPDRVGDVLQRMHRYGVLAAYLPAFEEISGMMQFDLFHVYTVDEHILTVVRNLTDYEDEDFQNEVPLCAHAYAEIPKRELLYLAGLFHDIGKGRGGDHSTLGAVDAIEFCQHHGLGSFDTNLVAWLVEKHLLMSSTAQRRDLSDPDIISSFAREMVDKMHLDYLYLLTVADIRGTNPALWNSWKNSLLRELYQKTLQTIRRGIENPQHIGERITEVQNAVLEQLTARRLPRKRVEELWEDLGDDYFLRHSPDEIAWQTETILSVENDDQLPLIKIRRETSRGATEIFIYCRDRDSLFAAMAYSIDQMALNVQDARIFTTKKGYNLDTYIVLEASTDKPVSTKKRIDDIRQSLKNYLSAPQPMLSQISRMRPRKLRSFDQPASIVFSRDEKNQRTIMEVIAIDQPGLLAVIGMAMAFCGVRLQNAKVATFGEVVEDIFYLTDLQDKIIDHPVKLQCLEQTILDALNS